MPLLRVMAACGMPHLRNLDEAVNIMRSAMLDVIQVHNTTAGLLASLCVVAALPACGTRPVRVQELCGLQELCGVQGLRGLQELCGCKSWVQSWGACAWHVRHQCSFQ
jgi:hypothetical protein